jgi:hypothetical protein
MRAVLLLLILVVVIAIGAIATGLININQTQSAQAPDIDATRRGVEATGGQTPKFDIETGKVAVGSRDATVKLPAIEVRPGGSATQNPQATPAPQDEVATTNSTQR